MKIVECSGCRAPVKRIGDPQPRTLCAECCRPAVSADQRQVAVDARERVDRRLRSFDAAGSYDGVDLSSYDEDTAWHRSATQAVKSHSDRLADAVAGRDGIIFTGPTGIGKTRAAVAICRTMALVDPAGVRVMTEPQLLDPDIPPWRIHDHSRRMLAGARTLLIDDIGTVSRPPDQVMSAWKLVADEIVAAEESVLFLGTTNFPSFDALSKWVGAQAMSRLAAFTLVRTTGWTDHRVGVEHSDWRRQLMSNRAS